MADGQVSTKLDKHTDQVTTALFCPKDQIVFTASYDAKCYIWDFKKGVIEFELIGHKLAVNCAVFNERGNIV